MIDRLVKNLALNRPLTDRKKKEIEIKKMQLVPAGLKDMEFLYVLNDIEFFALEELIKNSPHKIWLVIKKGRWKVGQITLTNDNKVFIKILPKHQYANYEANAMKLFDEIWPRKSNC